uniref:UDP-glucuronosyltransferase 2B7 n=1 Tax=Cacopsylla melanoneura TaxID=428564 RepID=A0A8D8M5W9_9HEMI
MAPKSYQRNAIQFLMSPVILVVFLLSLTLYTVECANILIICPTPSYSHQIPFIVIGKDLVRRGHTVTMIGTDPLKEPPTNFTQVDLSFSYKYFKPQLRTGEKVEHTMENQKKNTAYDFSRNVAQISTVYTEDQLKSDQMQKFLRHIDENKVTFDLIIYEALLHTAYLGFLPKLGYPPLISMTTINPTCSFGIHSGSLVCNPSYLPEILSGYTGTMSLVQRIDNLMLLLYTTYWLKPRVLKEQDALMEKYFHTSGIRGEDLVENYTLLMLSTSWLLTYPRPTLPNTILLGPIHLEDARPLPQELQQWMDGAKDGVIYFSLGSNMQSASLDEDKRKAILYSFRQFPNHRFLWKWETDVLPDLPPNVMCRKWMPQRDILAHPKVKLFITQGGLQSSQEAIHFGVPMIGIPYIADQQTNVRKLEEMGIARYLEPDYDITPHTLVEAIKSTLFNSTVQQKIEFYSKLSNMDMMPPLDLAYYWIEYVLKAKGNVDHLKVNLNGFPWYQYYLVDIAGIFVLLVAVVVCLVVFIFKFVVKLFCSRKAVAKKMKKR